MADEPHDNKDSYMEGFKMVFKAIGIVIVVLLLLVVVAFGLLVGFCALSSK